MPNNKEKVDNKKINRARKNKSAVSKTEITINNFGQRDINYEKFLQEHDRVSILSSVALEC